jgi:hypothetical protein
MISPSMRTQRLNPQFFEEQIAELERERGELEAEIDWWREGYERYKRRQQARETPKVRAPADGSRPTLRSGIQIVMREDDRSHWRVADLLDALKARGWEPRGASPQAPIAAMLADMKKRGEIYRLTRGVYALTPQEDVSSSNGAVDAADEEET